MVTLTFFRRFSILLFTVAILAGWAPAAHADDAAVATEVRALFEAGLKPSSKGVQSAEAHAEQARRLAPNDVRVQFALALVYMKNSKLENAAIELDAALANAKSPLLPVRRTRVVLAVLAKDFTVADRELRALATRLSDAELLGEAEQPYRDSAQFLESVLEFLAIRSEAALMPEKLASLEEEIQTRLKGGRAEAFRSGRLAVATRSSESDAESIAAQAEAKALHAKHQAERAAHAARVREAENSIVDINREIKRLEPQERLEDNPDPKDEKEKRKEKVKKEVGPAGRKIKSLKSKIDSIRQGLVDNVTRLNAEKKKLDSHVYSTKSALTMKSKALSTYLPLSLEAERDRVLASYRTN